MSRAAAESWLMPLHLEIEMDPKRGAVPEQRSLEVRVLAHEEVLFALVHHLSVEAPMVARPLAMRMRLHARATDMSEEARRLFVQIARLLEGG